MGLKLNLNYPLSMFSQYEWSLVNTTAAASSGGKMENGQEKMTVSGLGQGTYSFKVVVTGSDPRAEGEGLGVVTVLPRESFLTCTSSPRLQWNRLG